MAELGDADSASSDEPLTERGTAIRNQVDSADRYASLDGARHMFVEHSRHLVTFADQAIPAQVARRDRRSRDSRRPTPSTANVSGSTREM